MILYLNIAEILRLHFQVIEDFDGSHGIPDENRLKSVVAAPRQEAFGEEQYPDIFDKAAVYLRNIIGDLPFTDDNKRTAITAAGVFLIRNKTPLAATPKDLEDFAVRIAVDRLDIPAIAAWLRSHC